MNLEEWEKCSEYTLAKSNLLAREQFSSLFIFLINLFLLFPWFLSNWPQDQEAEIWHTSLASALFLMILQIPDSYWDWKRQFVLEARFGFNLQKFGLWFSDKIKQSLLGLIFLFAVFAFLDWGYRSLHSIFPGSWWVIAFLAFFGFQLLLMVFWPKFILPLFNELTPLPEGPLKERLMQLSRKTGFRTSDVKVMDGSRRSMHSNAFFTGFGNFRWIVLYDTLIEQMEDEEIEAVLAHEIGHYQLGHVPKRLLLSFVFGLASFAFLNFLIESDWCLRQLGMPPEHQGALGPALLTILFFSECFTYFFKPVSNYLSRRNEFEADSFAVRNATNANSLASALRKLHLKNLSYPLPHLWMARFHHSHPSLAERESNLQKEA